MENKVKWLNILSIKIKGNNSKPINPKTMKLALKLWNKEIIPENLPPIKVKRDKNGIHWIKDGRHRYLAFRLCGLTHIKSKIIIQKDFSSISPYLLIKKLFHIIF